MKNNTFHRITLSLICIIMMLLSACTGGIGSSANSDSSSARDDIMFSNIKSSASPLSSDEQEMLQSMQGLLSTVRLEKGEYGYYKWSMENPSSTDFFDFSAIICFYDEDGTLLLTDAPFSMDELKSGDKLAMSFYPRLASNQLPASVQIAAEFSYGASYYRTDFCPVGISYVQSVTCCNNLPMTFSTDDPSERYTLTDFQYDAFSSTITVFLTKESVGMSENGDLPYRIISDDGTVVAAGSFYLAYLNRGEKAKFSNSIDIPEGNYTIEFA